MAPMCGRVGFSLFSSWEASILPLMSQREPYKRKNMNRPLYSVYSFKDWEETVRDILQNLSNLSWTSSMPSSWPVGFFFQAYLSRSYNNPIYSQGASASLARSLLAHKGLLQSTGIRSIYIYINISIYYGFCERSKDVDYVRSETNLCVFVFVG